MASAEFSASFSFSPFLNEDCSKMRPMTYSSYTYPSPGEYSTLKWTISILNEFRTLLGHCLAVSYSLENDLNKLQDVPENEWPPCTVSSGSLIIKVLSDSPFFWSANGIVTIITVLRVGPDLAGLPQRILERWYLDAARAEKARQALEILQSARTEIVKQQRGGLWSETERGQFAINSALRGQVEFEEP